MRDRGGLSDNSTDTIEINSVMPAVGAGVAQEHCRMSANIMTASHVFLAGARASEDFVSSPVITNRDRAKLAELDERLLADIGIALDEVPMVRSGLTFTPRAWVSRR